jgi:hypothetical protein
MSPGPLRASERSLVLARAQELKLLEEERRRLQEMRKVSQLQYAASIPLPTSPRTGAAPARRPALEEEDDDNEPTAMPAARAHVSLPRGAKAKQWEAAAAEEVVLLSSEDEEDELQAPSTELEEDQVCLA